MNERDLFIAARQLDSVEKRRAFLTKACGSDSQLFARVSGLLEADEQAGSFLQHPAIDIATAADCGSDGTARTQLDSEGSDGDATTVSLDFLAPPRSSGSLGSIGHYEITELVGSGGMGIVLKANDSRLNRVVAVKVLAPELAGNPTARRRFVREGQAAAAIAHPHIVTIFAVDEDRLPYLVMEYVDGVSLQEKIDRDGQLQLKETLRIGAQIAAGLSAAHAQGVIHRDIKPANILLENGVERVRITDFGLARAVDDAAVTRAGEVAGTPQYMSPEQAQGRPVDARSDLFSLGCVLYAMCTGRSPFRAESSIASLRRVCDDMPRPIQEVNLDTPVWLSDIITQLLEKAPEDRIQSAAKVADLLNQHLAHLQNPSVAPAPLRVAARRRRKSTRSRRPWLIVGSLLAVATAAFGTTEAVGVTQFTATMVRIVTGEGTLVIEVDDPEVQISLDGEELSISGAGLQEVRLRPGQYQFRAMKGNTALRQELVTISRGDRAMVRVSREAPDTPQAPAPTDSTLWGEWVSLFNGSDLSGWITHPRQPDGWRVEDGAIVGSGPVSHLFTERGDYRDFELRAEVQITRTGNSGIYFRSPLDLVFLNGQYPPAYEIQIYNNDGPSGRDPYKTGSLHDKVLYRDVIVPGEDWFTLEIRVNGDQLIAAVNGVTTVNTLLLPDPWRINERGHFALQTTGGTVRFRKIEIREPVAVATASSFPSPQAAASAWTGWPADAPPPAIAPFDANQAAAHQDTWGTELGIPVEYTNSIGMKLRLIPPGEFMMGTPLEESTKIYASAAGWAHDHERSIVLTESPPHRVCLTQPFYLGAYEVTRAEFRRFVEATGYKTVPELTGLGGWAHYEGKWTRRPEQVWTTPGAWQPTDNEPVCVVTWTDAVAFCEWLSEVEGRRYALPTEAQWEFACRAGTSTATYAAADESLAAIAWTNELVMSAHPQPVGQKRANAFGLHDMLGNVWEHCADWYSPSFGGGEPQVDPPGFDTGVHRVLRGGAWYRSGYLFARSGGRNDFAESSSGSDVGIGFRVATVGDLRLDVARANEHMQQGRFDEAAAEFCIALSYCGPEDAPEARQKIVDQIVRSDELFERVVKLRPQDIDLWRDRGHFFAHQARWAEATQCYKTRLDLGHDGAGLWNFCANSLLAQADIAGYRAWCEQMLVQFADETHPDELIYATWVMVVTPDAVADKDNAFQLAERALAAKPNSPWALRNHTAWLYRLDRLEEAIAAWNTFSERGYEEYRLCFLAMAHHRLGNTQQARQYADEVQQRKPQWSASSAWPFRVEVETLQKETERVLAGLPDQMATRTPDDASPSGGEATAANASNHPTPRSAQLVHTFHHGAAIYTAAVSPDDRWIVTCGKDHALCLWDVETGAQVRNFDGHTAPSITVSFSTDGARLISSGWGDTTLRVWDVATGQELQRFQHGDAALGAALSPDGAQAATSDHGKSLRLWDANSGAELRRFDLAGLPLVRTIAFSPDGSSLLTGSLDGTANSVLRLWSVETGLQIRQFSGHRGWISGVAFSPDGKRAISSGWDQTVRLWDVDQAVEIRRFTHPSKIESAALSRDGRHVLSGGHDGTARLWNIDSGAEVLRVEAHAAGVWSVAFLSGDRRAMTASQDGTASLWDLGIDPSLPDAAATEP